MTSVYFPYFNENIAKNDSLSNILGINHIYEMKSTHDRIIECTSCIGKATDAEELDFDMVKKSIFEAVKQGDVDFVAHMGNENRQLIDVNDEEGKTIFHMAIECRQEEIYNLIYGLSEERRKEFGCSLTRYENDTSLLHSAGTLSPLSSFNHIQRCKFTNAKRAAMV